MYSEDISCVTPAKRTPQNEEVAMDTILRKTHLLTSARGEAEAGESSGQAV